MSGLPAGPDRLAEAPPAAAPSPSDHLTRPSLVETALLCATVLAPLLPAAWAIAALLLLAGGWLACRPARREVLLAGAGLAAAVLLLAAGWIEARPGVAGREAWLAAAGKSYADLWEDLRRRAAEAREQVDGPVSEPAARLEAFKRLAALVADGGSERASVLLVDPDGEARAWAGTGLLHEPDLLGLPASGVHFHAGFSSVSLMVVEPLDTGRRPWRVVVGRSLVTDRLPFAPPGGEDRRDFRWTLVAAGEPPAAAVIGTRLAPPGLPVLVLAPPPAQAASAPRVERIWFQGAWGAIAFALLALVVTRGVGLALSLGGRAGGRRAAALTALAMAGAAAGALAAAATTAAAAALVAGVGAAGAGLFAAGGWRRPGGRWGVAAGGAVAVLLSAAAIALSLRLSATAVLGPDLPGDARIFTLRLAAGFLTFGLLALVGRRVRTVVDERQRPAVAAALLLLAAGALADRPPAALALLAAGGAAVGWWLAGRRRWLRFGPLAALALLAALATGVGWELSYRAEVRRRLETGFLDALAPPDPAGLRAVRGDLESYFTALDLARLALRPVVGMERQDLAFSVWRDSPLARRNALSALVLLPAEEPGASVFSFGLPLNEENRLALDPGDRPDLSLPAWRDLMLTGETEVTAGGRPWGTARWWLLPRPGFRLGERQDVSEVLVGLLKGGRGTLTSPEGLPEAALFALYPPRGRALLSPWEESPPVPAALTGGARTAAVVATPTGAAWAFARRGPDGYEVLYLPLLGPVEALERVGTHAASILVVLAAAALAALLLALPRPAFRDLLGRTVRSYSKRLILVYTALLLLPLALLNFVLLRAVEARLSRDQRARGEQALIAAERAVVERILSTEPGFAFTTALSSQVLRRLSLLVDHEVNVYYGSDFLASSTGELFSAGLLPRRIPGEVYARLALVGFGIAARNARLVDTPYLELYAPVRVPGEIEEEPRLFVSVPLLAQQEETGEVLAALRRRALVATTGLFALVLVVGTRLARSFTKPLAELVEGTRRIAAGAPSLDLAPTELELAALVQAVDEMARRIARGREELLREKALVERMVESITSGVVSLDAAGRVLMHNRVAAELLGVRVGDRLREVVAAAAERVPVAVFLANRGKAGGGGQPHRETVRLPSAEGGEREWTLVWVPLPGAGEPSALLVVEDVTEVFRGQRLEAWAEMARIIAHEIKNPLTPVRLSAEHMRQVYATDPEHFGDIFERCTANILQQVDELQQIAGEFSTYSRIPRMEMRRDDLVEAMARLAEAYRAAPPPGVEVSFAAAAEPLPVRFDERLLARAVRNLIENALRASADGGRVALAVEAADGHARIVVSDSGPGVPPELLGRIFDPYFSTHDTGTGLGLPIARRIAEEHGGEIVARNRDGGGLEVEIKIPLA